jgi:hypothetical protein
VEHHSWERLRSLRLELAGRLSNERTEMLVRGFNFYSINRKRFDGFQRAPPAG